MLGMTIVCDYRMVGMSEIVITTIIMVNTIIMNIVAVLVMIHRI